LHWFSKLKEESSEVSKKDQKWEKEDNNGTTFTAKEK
jgi:hypothetical protein